MTGDCTLLLIADRSSRSIGTAGDVNRLRIAARRQDRASWKSCFVNIRSRASRRHRRRVIAVDIRRHSLRAAKAVGDDHINPSQIRFARILNAVAIYVVKDMTGDCPLLLIADRIGCRI